MSTANTTELGRIEDVGAAALEQGRRAAAGLRKLPVGPATREAQYQHFSKLLTSKRLFEPLGISTLSELEQDLHRLREAESYYTPPYGWEDSDDDLEPVQQLTALGCSVELVRARVAEALRLARKVHDLILAERVVGDFRGFGR